MRTLRLRAERLAELSAAELGAVAGGDATLLCLTDPCITRPVTGIWCLTREWCA